MLDYNKLMEIANELEITKEKFYEEKEPWIARAKEVAKYFQENKYTPKLISKNPSKYTFNTKKSYTFFGRYMNECSVYIEDETVEIRGTDYDDDLIGYAKLSVDDFLREDYKEYFDGLANKWKNDEAKKEKEDKERKEREIYEELKKRFG